MNSLEYTSIQRFKLAMRALLGGTFLPVQRTCKKKAKFSYRFSDPGRTGTLRALVITCDRRRYFKNDSQPTAIIIEDGDIEHSGTLIIMKKCFFHWLTVVAVN